MPVGVGPYTYAGIFLYRQSLASVPPRLTTGSGLKPLKSCTLLFKICIISPSGLQCDGGLSIFCSIEASGNFLVISAIELKILSKLQPTGSLISASKEHSDGTILFFKPPEIVPILRVTFGAILAAPTPIP